MGKKYDFLIKHWNLKNKDEDEELALVNERIDKIIATNSNEIEIIKALICSGEGKSSLSLFYAIMSITYALVIGAATILCSYIDKALVGLVLLGAALIISIIALSILHREYRKAFVLNVLKFRYEEMKKDKVSEKIIEETKASEVSEEYKEFVVRVKRL